MSASDSDRCDADARADDNVERLIGRAYQPDVPDAAFVKRVEERLLVQAAAGRKPRLAWVRRLVPAAAAAALIATVGWLAWTAETQTRLGVSGLPVASAELPTYGGDSAHSGERTPRTLPPAPIAVAVAVGDELVTGAAERRRVTLPDGSVLFVDANTRVTVEAARRVRVAEGNVYVEVRPDPNNVFRVVTPRRELTALGTRFAVDVAASGATDLLVTHGRVAVDDIDRVVTTGERLVDRDGHATVEQAPRTSHVIDWTRDLAIAAESALVPSSGKEGGALLAIDPWGQEARLSLRKYHVDVHIEDGFARTTIDQTYFNHATWRMEGTFYFPLPADASLSRLAMYVAGDLMEGGMTERNRARDVYEEIRYQRRDPALLEWIDGSTFKMRVFPLEPREEKRILLSYTQRLPEAYGKATYRFPAGHDLGIVDDWSFSAHIAGETAWRCDSHALAETRDGASTVLAAAQRGVLLDDDVVLSLRSAVSATPGASAFRTFTHDGQRYLMVRHRPDLATTAVPERRDWIVLFESSGARDPVVARAQVEIVRELLSLAEEGDRFAVITAATRTRALSDVLLPATPENVAAAIDFLEHAHLVGAVDLGRALDATRPFVKASASPMIVHVGSGVPSLGERDEASLVRRVPAEAHYVGVAVGKQWSRGFMKEAAARTGGLFTQIQPTEPLRWRTFDLRATLDTPRLLGVSVVDDAERAPFLVFDDAAAHGEEIAAITRVPEGEPLPATITVAARLGGRAWSRTLRVAGAVDGVSDGAGYLPRQWARLQIDRLVAAGAEENHDEIVALSKAMYVMSPFTSLLVLENEAMYAQFGVDRGRKDHWALYPAPEKIPVVREPVGATSAETPEGRSVDDLLGTILVRQAAPILWDASRNSWDGWTGWGTYTVQQLLQIRSQARSRQGWYGYVQDLDLAAEIWDGFGRRDREGRFARLRELEGGGPALPASELNSALVPFVSGWGGGGGRGASPLRLAEIGTFEKSVSREYSGPMGEWYSRNEAMASSAPTDAPVGAPMAVLDRLERFREVDTRSGRRPLLQAAGRDFSTLFSRVPRRLGLLYLGSAESMKPDSSISATGLSRGAGGVMWRMNSGALYQALQYQRPQPYNAVHVFTDLLGHAPGMNTNWTDVVGVLEREGGVPVRRGEIDAAAAALIREARNARFVTITDENGAEIHIDGTGRCRMERTLPSGLREIVVSDGEMLRHLYPDLGVGARRVVDRHLRAAILAMTPWLVAPAEDLAVGAHVRLLSPGAVELVPLDEDASTIRVRLVFGDDGRLAERQLVDVSFVRDGPKVLIRESYEYGDDSVDVYRRVTTPREQSSGVTGIIASDAGDVSLDVDASDLVVIPLPYRDRQTAFAQTGQLNSGKWKPETWDEEKALALIGHTFCRNVDEAAGIIAKRFLDRGDTRVGFAVLLRAGNPDQAIDARLTGQDNSLARYIGAVKGWDTNARLELDAQWRTGLVGELALYRDVLADWSTGRSQGDRLAFAREVLAKARDVRHPEIRYALAASVMNNVGLTSDTARPLIAACEGLEEAPWLGSYVAYDRAAALQAAGDREAAADAFYAWHDDMLSQGRLPPVDHQFATACRSPDEARWLEHWRRVTDDLIERRRRDLVPYVALQLSWIGDGVGADQALDAALADVPAAERPRVVVGAIESLIQRGEWVRAEALVAPLLDEATNADVPQDLLALGSFIATQRGATAQAVRRRERLLDMRYAEIPELLNLAAMRQDHAELLQQFLQLARAVQALEAGVSTSLVARVVRIADRWRALDDDPSSACILASQIFSTLGDDALAWDYLTTPLASRPNESEPWVQMAQQVQAGGDIDLADRCYVTAFEIEPTNADILAQRAHMLAAAGRLAAAREVWRVVAEGTWQPRFDDAKRAARARLER